MKWLTTEVYSILYYLTAGPFFAEIFHRWAVFCRNSSQLGRFLLGHFLLGCSLQKYFTTGPFTARPISAGLFSAKIFHRWAIYRWVVFSKNSSQLDRFLLGCSLQEYFTAGPSSAGPFSAEALYRWVIFCKKYFTAGLFLTVCIFIILTYLL